MFRKFGIVALAVVAGVLLLRSSSVGSYTSTIFNKVRGQVKNQVPLEFEIERVRHEIAQLIPDMKKSLSSMATEMVAVENLKTDISKAKGKLADHKESILVMTNDLDTGVSQFTYDGKTWSAEKVRRKLENDFAAYKRLETDVRTKEQMLEARERSLEVAKEQLGAIRTQKEELELQVAQLEADLKAVRLAETRCKVQIDNSRLARIKESIADIQTRMQVAKVHTELQGEFAGSTPVAATDNTKPQGDLLKDVKAHMSASK